MRKSGWFNFSTRDIVVMAVLVALTGVFQTFWAHLVFQAQVLGPFRNFFTAYGFNIATFIVLYLLRKPGSATIVKFFAAILELALGNPVGPVVLFYGFVEGFAADIAFVVFRRKINLSMIIAGSLMAWIFAAPVDAYIDAVPFTLEGLVLYFGPGGMGKVWTSLWVFWTLLAMQRAGIKPIYSGKEIVAPASQSI
jgi:ABC-type thiamin/hydroxymethylpyrimidine transport system permease subunit